MSFIATANPPAHGAEQSVANDGFWPDISREQLRKDARLDGTVTPERLLGAVEAAMWSVNAELQAWQDTQVNAGHQTLDDVPARQLGGASVKTRQYLRAIRFHVQAQLAEAYRDIDTLPQGAGKEPRVLAAQEARVDGFNEQLRRAIADVQDKPATIVELL